MVLFFVQRPWSRDPTRSLITLSGPVTTVLTAYTMTTTTGGGHGGAYHQTKMAEWV
jgi:hypothetical protein